MKHLTAATLAAALALAFAQVALARTEAPVRAPTAVNTAAKPVVYVSPHRTAPKQAPAGSGAPAARRAAPAPDVRRLPFPDNDGSRFQYDSCGCLGS